MRGYDPDVFLYQTDLDKAKELILAGGFKEGDVFEYMVDANEETDQTVAQLFQANVQADGLRSRAHLGRLRHDRVDRLRRRAARGASALYRRLGLVARLQRPWNQLWPNFTEANVGGGGSNGGAWVNPRFEEIMAGGGALRERGATRRTDERSPEHPDRAGSARHLLMGNGSTSRFLAPTSRGSSRTRSTSRPTTPTECRGHPPDPTAIG